jgi:hypothetical protein
MTSYMSDPDPLERPPFWTFTTSTTSAPVTQASSTVDGTDEVITNSAGDPIKGLTAMQLNARMVLNGRSQNFPTEWLGLVNKVNADEWAGKPAGSWLCSGFNARESSEMVENQVKKYYEYGLEFTYRETLWRLRVADVGSYYIDTGGTKRQAYIEDENGNHVSVTKPVPLNTDGSIKTSGNPNILTLYPYSTGDFSTLPTVPTDES